MKWRQTVFCVVFWSHCTALLVTRVVMECRDIISDWRRFGNNWYRITLVDKGIEHSAPCVKMCISFHCVCWRMLLPTVSPLSCDGLCLGSNLIQLLSWKTSISCEDSSSMNNAAEHAQLPFILARKREDMWAILFTLPRTEVYLNVRKCVGVCCSSTFFLPNPLSMPGC